MYTHSVSVFKIYDDNNYLKTCTCMDTESSPGVRWIILFAGGGGPRHIFCNFNLLCEFIKF